MKAIYVFAVVTLNLAAPVSASSEPPTAAMAKECRDKAVSSYPTSTAGAKHGNAAAQRELFKKCVSEMQQEQKKSGRPARRYAVLPWRPSDEDVPRVRRQGVSRQCRAGRGKRPRPHCPSGRGHTQDGVRRGEGSDPVLEPTLPLAR
jgi:hypothetical protein